MLIENSVVINRPVEAVWSWFLDWGNQGDWYQGIVDYKQVSEGPVGMGTKIKMLVRIGPWKVWTPDATITAFEPHRLIQFTPGPTRFIFQPVGEATRLTKSQEYHGMVAVIAGAIRLIKRPLAVSASREQQHRERNFAELKRRLETPAAAPGLGSGPWGSAAPNDAHRGSP